ncbi:MULTISPECIES: acyl carrier protein [Shewanella]|jgi:acyl carrier protein|uniref:Acyl carrier protein n=2 Tax=Shewanella putrefaciens TaxID=24 RepID=A4Y8R1_SHEPC|nr:MULTISPECIES: acyl carrier protein [Shewanella]ABM24227.1 acyl carrier protein [Shewanella sp. W3-18-1]AVV85947.1 acyl carrier protein [Shewanella putrefaciens]MCT8944970.1 acyl carrier protein [Shewanella putrefaciens]MCU8014157.1 acyl carrier protein [Shewanella sp. SM74]MCU8023360.1 acyl carrier protein [Shewanella sp. SM78]
MTRLEVLFSNALGLDIEKIHDELAYNSVPEWDSVAHMGLIAQLEDAYDVLLDTDDIIDMSSVGKARVILAKYGVNS